MRYQWILILGFILVAFLIYQSREQMGNLNEAVKEQNQKQISKLIKKGADPNACFDDSTPLIIAASEGFEQITKMLVKQGAKVNSFCESGRGALHYAAANGNEPMVRYLLENGATCDLKDARETTPLMLTLSIVPKGYVSISRILLDCGADPNAADEYGQTALHFAATKGKKDAATLLIERGARVDSKDHEGRTPLHFAAAQGISRVLRLLIEKGADVQMKDKIGSMPLHFAAANGNDKSLLLLVEADADVNAKNGEGQSPLRLAAEGGHEQTVGLIRSAGGLP